MPLEKIVCLAVYFIGLPLAARRQDLIAEATHDFLLHQEYDRQDLESQATAYPIVLPQRSVRRRVSCLTALSSRLFARGGRRPQGRLLVRTPNVVYHYRYNGLGVRSGKVRSYSVPIR